MGSGQENNEKTRTVNQVRINTSYILFVTCYISVTCLNDGFDTDVTELLTNEFKKLKIS